MSQIDDAIETLNGLDAWMQWSVGFAATFLTVAIVRFLLDKILLDFVKKTSFGWDDKLYDPVTKRIYLFILITGTLFTMRWVWAKTIPWLNPQTRCFKPHSSYCQHHL